MLMPFLLEAAVFTLGQYGASVSMLNSSWEGLG